MPDTKHSTPHQPGTLQETVVKGRAMVLVPRTPAAGGEQRGSARDHALCVLEALQKAPDTASAD